MPMLTGHGRIFRGPQELGEVDYLVHVEPDGHSTLVELHPAAHVRDGAVLHLAMDDGRYVVCQNIDHSKYCAVVGDGPNPERRTRSHEAAPRHTIR
jgi:hypothetical protein